MATYRLAKYLKYTKKQFLCCEEKLPFSVIYRFLQAHKEYIFKKYIPYNACLRQICKNLALLAKGVSSIAPVKI